MSHNWAQIRATTELMWWTVTPIQAKTKETRVSGGCVFHYKAAWFVLLVCIIVTVGIGTYNELLLRQARRPIDEQTGKSGSCRVRAILLASSGSTTKTAVSSESANKRSREKKGEVNHGFCFNVNAGCEPLQRGIRSKCASLMIQLVCKVEKKVALEEASTKVPKLVSLLANIHIRQVLADTTG